MFNIDFDRLVALLLPTFLRRKVLYALLHSAVAAVKTLYDSFTASRSEHNCRLTHNGQVCRLRACLNDSFKSALGTIGIDSVEYEAQWLYAVNETGEMIPIAVSEEHDANDGTAITLLIDESILSRAQNDFIVSVPRDLYDSSLEEIKALVNKYKLVTKSATYVSKTY